MIVGDGTTVPVAESGATLRTSIGVDAAGTDNSTNVTLAGSLDYLTISGQEITRGAVVLTTDISGTLPIANGGTNATSAGAARTALGAAASGANSDITSITGLTTDLTVAQGGTGAGTFAANGILYGAGTGAIAATAVGTDGHVLTSNGSGVAPTFQAAAGGGATDINGLSDALTNSSGGTIGLGTGALAADDGSANKNTALGYNALNDATTGTGNTSLGNNAGAKVTTGSGNIMIGNEAGGSLGPTTTNYNTFVGTAAGRFHPGPDATLIGYNAGRGVSGSTTTAAEGIVAVGHSALMGLTTGTNNTAVGYNAGGATTAGFRNTYLGFNAGNTTTTGAYNTVIGYDAEASSATVSNEITLGSTVVTKFRIPGINFVIKDTTATDNYVLTVDSSGEAGWEAAAGGATDWEVISSTGSVSAGTYVEITGFNMVRLQAVASVTGTAHSHGINLSTSGSSNSGVSTQNGRWYRKNVGNATLASNPQNITGAYTPSTSSLYYGSSDPANTNSNLEMNLYGLDETNVGIMLQEQSLTSNTVNRWAGQTTSGSSAWFLYFAIAMDGCLVVGCK
jgi:hypothetical protein